MFSKKNFELSTESKQRTKDSIFSHFNKKSPDTAHFREAHDRIELKLEIIQL